MNTLAVYTTFILLFLSEDLLAELACPGTAKKVRLEGMESKRVGWVQVCEEGEWKNVCLPATQSSWSHSNAAVTCRELGYTSGVALSVTNRLAISPDSTSSHMTGHVTCTGLEDSLDKCTITNEAQCGEAPVIIMCSQSPPVGSVRLVHVTGSEYSGVVEVYTGREWATICTDEWSSEESNLVCKHIGYSSGSPSNAQLKTKYLRGLAPKKLNYFQCSGNETSLLDCSHRTYTRKCHTATFASVICDHSNDPGSDCPSLSFHDAMIFVTVQLGILLLIVGLGSCMLVACKRWRNSKQSHTPSTTNPVRIGLDPHYQPPPAYSEANRDTLIEYGSSSSSSPSSSPPSPPSPPPTNDGSP